MSWLLRASLAPGKEARRIRYRDGADLLLRKAKLLELGNRSAGYEAKSLGIEELALSEFPWVR